MTTQTQIPGRNHRRWILIGLGSILVLVLLSGITTWGAGQSAKTQLAAQYPAPGQLVDIGGYKLHLNCMGEGSPTVIMDAGNNDFSVTWATVQPEIGQFTKVCSYDRAGFGWSEPSPLPRTSSVMVGELHTLLAAAELESPFVLVGHSFGGVNMRLYAHQYPSETQPLGKPGDEHDQDGDDRRHDLFRADGPQQRSAVDAAHAVLLVFLPAVGHAGLGDRPCACRCRPGRCASL